MSHRDRLSLIGDSGVVEATTISESKSLPHCLKWFTKISEKRQIEACEEIHVPPAISFLTNEGPMYFRIPPSPIYCVDLNTALIRLKTQIKRKDGLPLGPEDNVGVISSPLIGMFKSVKLVMQGTTISQPHTNYNTVVYAIQEITKDAQEHNYYLNPISLADKDTDPANNPDCRDDGGSAAEPNVGLVQRSGKYKNSRIVELIGAVGQDFISTNEKLIPPNVSIELEFQRSDNSMVLMSPHEDKYDFHVLEAYVSVRRARVESGVMAQLYEKLQKNPAIFPYRVIKPYVFQVPKNSSNAIATPFWSSLPKRAFLFFVRSSAISPGKVTENPRIFYNLNIRQVKFLVDGRTHGKPIVTDFQNQQVASAYMSLLQMLARTNDNFRPPQYDFSDFLNFFAVWGVDLSTDEETTRVPEGQLTVEVDFTNGLLPDDNYTGFLCGEGSAVVTIDKNFQVEDRSTL